MMVDCEVLPFFFLPESALPLVLRPAAALGILMVALCHTRQPWVVDGGLR